MPMRTSARRRLRAASPAAGALQDARTWPATSGSGRAASGERTGERPLSATPTMRTTRPGEDLSAKDDIRRVVRGGSWYLLRDLARCAVRLWRPPNHWFAHGGFRVLLRRSHVLPHFFWLRRQAQRCDGTPVPLAFRKCRPIRASGFAGRGEGRRTAPDASGPRARRKAGRHRGSARAGQIAKHGHGLAKRPPCPPRPRPGAMPACSGATSRRAACRCRRPSG